MIQYLRVRNTKNKSIDMGSPGLCYNLKQMFNFTSQLFKIIFFAFGDNLEFRYLSSLLKIFKNVHYCLSSLLYIFEKSFKMYFIVKTLNPVLMP